MESEAQLPISSLVIQSFAGSNGGNFGTGGVKYPEPNSRIRLPWTSRRSFRLAYCLSLPKNFFLLLFPNWKLAKSFRTDVDDVTVLLGATVLDDLLNNLLV